MNMHISKIQNSVVAGTANDKPAASSRTKEADDSGSRVAASDDSVNLSSAATGMGKLEQSVAASDGIDRAKIDAIKDALKHGDYPFDPTIIADKMIGMERLLS